MTIKQMSRDGKLRVIKELWQSLTEDAARLESPPWHRDALRETAERYSAGQEQPIDWSAAKRELRKRAD
jgi:hypothetical protein